MIYKNHWVTGLSSLLILLAVTAVDAFASKPQEKELAELRNRIKAISQQLNQDRAQHSTVRDQLTEVEIGIVELNRKLHNIRSKIENKNREVLTSEVEIEQLQRELAIQRTQLKNLIYSSYLTGRNEYFKLLLNQEEPQRLGRTMAYYRYLSQGRANEILAVQALVKQLERLKSSLESEQQELKALEVDQLSQREKLDLAREERSELLARLEQQIGSEQEELSQLERKAQRLEQLLKDLRNAMADLPPEGTFNQRFSNMRGKLPLPLRGLISARFGQAKRGTDVSWQGIFLDAKEGAKVRSIFPGRVAYADWLRGFGLLLILDHGDGYMSLYSHNQILYKEVGEWVNSDETIALVGSSGGLKKTGLYFEIRHNGKPHNPLIWCKVD